MNADEDKIFNENKDSPNSEGNRNDTLYKQELEAHENDNYVLLMENCISNLQKLNQSTSQLHNACGQMMVGGKDG